jgi:hypothetical protein
MRNKYGLETDATYVAPAAKKVPYTVIPIGDANSLKAWRSEQEHRETLWQANKSILEASRRSKAILMVEEQMSTVSFTPEEREEIQTLIRKRQLEDTEAKLERARYEQDYAAFYPAEIPTQKTFWQRCQERLSRVWRDAFDSEQ